MSVHERSGGQGATGRSGFGESSSLANDDFRKAGIGSTSGGVNEFPISANRSNSAKKSGKKEAIDDYEDDYIDDDFEEEDESGSGVQSSSLKPATNLQK